MTPASATSPSPRKHKPDICIALDGFLATAQPLNRPIGPPRPGAAEFMKRLAKNYHCIVYSPRLNFHLDPDALTETQLDAKLQPIFTWFRENKVWYDGVWIGRGRPDAALYLGPNELATPADPLPDDFVDVEQQIKERIHALEPAPR